MSYRERRRREFNADDKNITELATITITANDDIEVGAEGISEYRDMKIIAPQGIFWNPTEGQSGQLLKNWGTGNSVTLNGIVINTKVEPGEITLYSEGGAKIELKNDGNIILNESVTILKDGSININGNININGKINISDTMTIGEVAFASDFIRK